LLRDIGWGEHDVRESWVLTMPSHALRELLRRLHDEAAHILIESGIEAQSSRDDAATNGRFQIGYETCEKVLASLNLERRRSQ